MMPTITRRHYGAYASINDTCYSLSQAVALVKDLLERRYNYESITITNGNRTLYEWSGVSKAQAKAFYADVLGTVGTNGNDLIVSAEYIADRMGISPRRAKKYLWACAKHGITERQGGGWVI